MTLHLVEPIGYSGIFQRTVALAEALASTGETVVFHTAAEHEELPAVGFTYCPSYTTSTDLTMSRTFISMFTVGPDLYAMPTG